MDDRDDASWEWIVSGLPSAFYIDTRTHSAHFSVQTEHIWTHPGLGADNRPTVNTPHHNVAYASTIEVGNKRQQNSGRPSLGGSAASRAASDEGGRGTAFRPVEPRNLVNIPDTWPTNLKAIATAVRGNCTGPRRN